MFSHPFQPPILSLFLSTFSYPSKHLGRKKERPKSFSAATAAAAAAAAAASRFRRRRSPFPIPSTLPSSLLPKLRCLRRPLPFPPFCTLRRLSRGLLQTPPGAQLGSLGGFVAAGRKKGAGGAKEQGKEVIYRPSTFFCGPFLWRRVRSEDGFASEERSFALTACLLFYEEGCDGGAVSCSYLLHKKIVQVP